MHEDRWIDRRLLVVAAASLVLAACGSSGGRVGTAEEASVVPAAPVATTPGSDAELGDGTAAADSSLPRATTTPIDTGTTPIDTGTAVVTVVGGGFDLLVFPRIGVADDAAALAALLADSRRVVDVAALPVDWATSAVVVVAVPTDACPPVLADLEIDADTRTARPVFVNPGYQACDQPLLSHTTVTAVDRSLLAGVDRLELPPHSPFFEEAVTTDVDVDVVPGLPATPVPPTPVDVGAVRGTADLPPVGEAGLGMLDDGLPVFVIHHHDGTISALDPRTALGGELAEPGSLRLVGWVGATRHFLNGGAWDEYGRRLDGFRDSDLRGFATRVVDGRVDIGAPVAPPAGSPIATSADAPSTADVLVSPAAELSIDEALALPPGRWAWVSADVVIGPEGALLCDAPLHEGSIEIDACPDGSPTVDGVPPTADLRSVWFGPLLLERTASGFGDVVATGGSAGVSLVLTGDG